MEEHLLIAALPNASIEGIILESSPFEQYNYFIMLDKISNTLSVGSLESICKLLPKIYMYDSLKIALGILIKRKVVNQSVESLISETELAWPECANRQSLCRSARKRLNLVR